jgi:ATP-binding cassette subfamily B protein
MGSGRLGVYRRLLGYLRPHWRHVAAAYIAMILATLMNLAVPQIIKQAIDNGLEQGSATMLFWRKPAI